MFASNSTSSTPITSNQIIFDNTQRHTTLRSFYTRSDYDNHGSSSDDDNFQILLNKSWDVYNVSPLYRLDYSEIELKRYSKWMREQIVNFVSEKKKNQQYIVEFSAIKSFNSTNNGIDSLRVEIQSKSTNKTSVLYEGIFLSTGSESTKKIHTSFKCLPILISRSAQYTATTVHGLLQRLFDCKICKIYLDKNDFKWLTVLFCTDINFIRISTTVDLTYNLWDNKNTLHVGIELNSLAQIWESVKGDDPQLISLEQVEEFHKILNVIIKKTFQIDVQTLHFKNIKMSHISINYPCKIKVNDSKLLKEFLVFQNGTTNIFTND